MRIHRLFRPFDTFWWIMSHASSIEQAFGLLRESIVQFNSIKILCQLTTITDTNVLFYMYLQNQLAFLRNLTYSSSVKRMSLCWSLIHFKVRVHAVYRDKFTLLSTSSWYRQCDQLCCSTFLQAINKHKTKIYS